MRNISTYHRLVENSACFRVVKFVKVIREFIILLIFNFFLLEILFVALRNGDILRADASTNPCRIVHRVNTKLASEKETINCICLYEYVVQSTLQNDSWKGIMKSLKATKSAQQGKIQSKDRTLLIAGRKDGCIAVLDWKTLTTLYKTDVSQPLGFV